MTLLTLPRIIDVYREGAVYVYNSHKRQKRHFWLGRARRRRCRTCSPSYTWKHYGKLLEKSRRD
jgi:hypothetical protein